MLRPTAVVCRTSAGWDHEPPPEGGFYPDIAKEDNVDVGMITRPVVGDTGMWPVLAGQSEGAGCLIGDVARLTTSQHGGQFYCGMPRHS